MKLLIIQTNPKIGDLKNNSKYILKEINKFKSRDELTLVITPELSLWGYPPRDLLFSNSIFDIQNEILDEFAKKLDKNFALLIGIVEKDIKNNLFNACALIRNNSWKVIYRKQLLPRYDVFEEDRYFMAGTKKSVINFFFNKKNYKVGLTICEDIWFKEFNKYYSKDPITSYETENLDLLINISASPYSKDKQTLRERIVKDVAERLTCSCLYVNQIGGNDELVFDGGSFLTNKRGEIISQLSFFKEESKLIFSEKAESTNREESDINKLLFKSLVKGTKDYLIKCNFKKVVLGLSGGIDSALVTVLATAALGNKNVKCILMPSRWSSAGSINDSKMILDKLEIESKLIPIEELIKQYKNIFEYSKEDLKNITLENLQSRIRGTILMAISNNEDSLLLTTGNKSELSVGYCTLYGDMNGGLNIIGDIYKTEVFSLAKWIDEEMGSEIRQEYNLPTNGEIIGREIRHKEPSAELSEGQKDCDSLPKYDVLDPILNEIIDKKLTLKELISKGFDEDLCISILKLVSNSEFKRKQAAPILRVSERAFGIGWRMPIAANKQT